MISRPGIQCALCAFGRIGPPLQGLEPGLEFIAFGDELVAFGERGQHRGERPIGDVLPVVEQALEAGGGPDGRPARLRGRDVLRWCPADSLE